MITITVYGSSKTLTGFEVSGHAGYADKGYDIVCAAVSALATSCANGLEELVKAPVAIEVKQTGYIKVLLGKDISPRQQEQTDLLVKTMLLSLDDMAGQYPQHVRVLYKNGGNQHD